MTAEQASSLVLKVRLKNEFAIEDSYKLIISKIDSSIERKATIGLTCVYIEDELSSLDLALDGLQIDLLKKKLSSMYAKLGFKVDSSTISWEHLC